MTRTTNSDWCDRLAACSDKLRIIPKLAVIAWFGFTIYVGHWFMQLPDPSAVQMTFTSAVIAALATILGFYKGSIAIGQNAQSRGKD